MSITKMIKILQFITTSLHLVSVFCLAGQPNDADHMTAIYGDSVVLNCNVDFPDGTPVPYVVQWSRKDEEVPIYMWYANYPEHIQADYLGRVNRVSSKSNYGLASLNLTQITERDRGWYNCKVMFINRDPEALVNGSWFHLDVHAKPHFTVTPDDIVYVNIHDSIILNCQAAGTPVPEILWFKEEATVVTSNRLGIFNDGTELRISNILAKDLGDYTCIARNGEGRIHHTAKVIMAGAPVIVSEPKNLTKQEGSDARFPCKSQANPDNLTISWFKEKTPIKTIHNLSLRTQIVADGTLLISPIVPSDEGRYSCEVTNGIGKPIEASAYLSVEYPARVTYTPTIQYVPRGLRGTIQCHIESNPPIQFVTWTKDKRIYDPFELPGVEASENGSIVIDHVNQHHAGEYKCTPYNIHGTTGPSGVMQVVIKDPPTLIRKPEASYHRSIGGKVTMPCGAIGTPPPEISWTKPSSTLPKKRSKEYNGELTIDNLRKGDHGIYECVVSNEVATIIARTELFIEKTTPHAPTNITITETDVFAVTIQWLPGYSGCASCQQSYKIRYREKNSKFPNWIELPVNPSDARKIQIHNLSATTTYEFQVIGTNEYGDGMFSEIVEASTKDLIYFDIRSLPIDEYGRYIFPNIPQKGDAPPGEKPDRATNLTITEEAGGWVLRWEGNKDDSRLKYYTIQMKGGAKGSEWVSLTDQRIDVEESSYMLKNLGLDRAYLFRVYSHSLTSFSVSDELLYSQKNNVKQKAVTAGLIGGLLFFIVAIVLSVCTVKICNKRRRAKHERAYNIMVCRKSDNSGSQNSSQGPLKRSRTSRVSTVRAPSFKKRLFSLVDCVSECVLTLDNKIETSKEVCEPELDYSDGRRRSRVSYSLNPNKPKLHRYSIRIEQKQENQYNNNNHTTTTTTTNSSSSEFHERRVPFTNFIHRTTDGKFILDDEGGFDLSLPPNRFRTKGVALLSGYDSERLYSNMPHSAFIVESGVYKVGASREDPVYWKQIVYPKEYFRSHNVSSLELPKDPTLRASSPLLQGAPLLEWTSPIYNTSEISSVPHPSSIEKSFPSTLLTSGLSGTSRSQTTTTELAPIFENETEIFKASAEIHESLPQESHYENLSSPLATSSPPPPYSKTRKNNRDIDGRLTEILVQREKETFDNSSLSMESPFYENWPLPPLDPHFDTSNESNSLRPNSAHSAPLLDLSIDRHYEFDSHAIDDINIGLPRQWNRPYLGYNPRRDRAEIGAAANLSTKVFSDSEIYSPVFPRGKPMETINVSERVQAMKREFQEYKDSQVKAFQKTTHKSSLVLNLKSKTKTKSHLSTLGENNRLESII